MHKQEDEQNQNEYSRFQKASAAFPRARLAL